MSNRNNDVFSVLVSKGNQPLLPAGNTVSALAPGQIGIFDTDTGLSVLGTAPRNFEINVGLGTTSLDDLKGSAGQYIQKKNVTDFTYQPHTAGQDMIVKIGNFKTECETDYSVKIEFSNSLIRKRIGYVPFSKTYSIRTSCCDCADGCGSGDANEVSILLNNTINIDTANGFVTSQIIARQALTAATHGTSVNYAVGAVMTEADAKALITFNKTQTNSANKVYTDLKLTSVAIKIKQYCDINLGFHSYLGTTLLVSLLDGFSCTGAVTVLQNVAYEEGSGVNVRQLEYHASAWNGSGPYVASSITGLSLGNIKYEADANAKYDQFALQYTFESNSGWGDYGSPLSTIIAIPEADTVTRNSFVSAMDAITATLGFEPLADDATAASTNPNTVEPQAPDNTKDGIA